MLNLFHRHHWTPWHDKTQFTGEISLRLSDGMLMAKTWTDRIRTCGTCGITEVLCDGNGVGVASSGGEVATGTKIDIRGLNHGGKRK